MESNAISEKLHEIDLALSQLNQNVAFSAESTEKLAEAVSTISKELPVLASNIQRLNELSRTVKEVDKRVRAIETSVEVIKAKHEVVAKIAYGGVGVALTAIANSIFKFV